MFTRISDGIRARRGPWRLASVVLLPLALSGCLEGAGPDAVPADRPKRLSEIKTTEGGLGFLSSLKRPIGPVLQQARTAGGAVVIAGPEGYCVEGRSLKTRQRGGFAVLARCDILSGGDIGAPVALALLTVTIAPAGDVTVLPSAADMARDFTYLGVLDMVDGQGVHMLHLETGGNDHVPAVDPRHWRGAFLLNGYVVGLAAYGPRDSSVVADGGQALLLAMARRMRSASPEGAPSANPEAAETVPALADAGRPAGAAEAPATPAAATSARSAEADGPGAAASADGPAPGGLSGGLFP
ncbi:hypothetical protein [Pseudooceanicola aestuarii]|uniref:hypothetical protein n=1 Tax=Pseudooceanicola aestuarii TaxID=2697319 RepID=UPI0013D068B5|nr:hypothetical protein [Pseudooceanicola aestuarii]